MRQRPPSSLDKLVKSKIKVLPSSDFCNLVMQTCVSAGTPQGPKVMSSPLDIQIILFGSAP